MPLSYTLRRALFVAAAALLVVPFASAQERLTSDEYYQARTRPAGATAVNAQARIALSPESVADALGLPSGAVVSADFGTSDVTSYGIFSIGAAGFPTEGGEYVVLSSGMAGDALVPDLFASTELTNVDPQTGVDITQLTLTLNVPQGADFPETLRFDARVGSEEYPVFVGSQFNDFVLVETPESTFTIDEFFNVTAPNNVAVDQNGNLISINTSGPTSFSFAQGVETAFNGCDDGSCPDANGGATPLLTQIVPIPDGAQTITIVISVGDQGDSGYDTAIFLDNFEFSGLGGGGTIASCPETLFIEDFNTDAPESVSLLNFGTGAADLSGCTVVSFDPFTEQVISSSNLDGESVDAGDTYTFTGFAPNSLRDMFGAIAVINGPEVAIGTAVGTVLSSRVAAVVYVTEDMIIGKYPASPGVTRTASDGADLPALLAELRLRYDAFQAAGLTVSAGPNPTAGHTRVTVAVPEAAPVRLVAYDALGREVARIVDGQTLETGIHTFAFDAEPLPAGVYFLRLDAGGAVRTAQVVRSR